MVDCVKLASILKHENLICQVLCHVSCLNFNLGALGNFSLGDVKDFASWSAIFAAVATELGLTCFIRPQIRERRGEADREPVVSSPRRWSKWVAKQIHRQAFAN